MTPEDITKILEEASVGHPGVSQIKLIWEHKFPAVVAAIMAFEEPAEPNMKERTIEIIMNWSPRCYNMTAIDLKFPKIVGKVLSWNKEELNKLSDEELLYLYEKAIK